MRVQGFAREWANRGHQVAVLTGFPNHPEGVLHAEFRARWRRGFARESSQGINIYRTWLYPAANQGSWKRSASYASFTASATLTGPWIAPRHGIVIGSSPQLLAAAAAYAIARARRLPFVFEVRDLWPQSLVAVGASSEGSALYRGLDRIANYLYRHAETVVVDGEWKRKQLIEAGVSNEKVRIVRNGVAGELIEGLKTHAACSARERVRRERGWNGRFVAMYAGTMGMAHGLETMLTAAEHCKSNPQILFVMIGAGAERERLIAKTRELHLDNVEFLPRQPHDSIPPFLLAADVCLVLLRRTEVFKTAIPSKMFEAMAAARPLVLGVEGEAKEILLTSEAGLAVPPQDAGALAEAINRLWKDSQLRQRLGENGKRSAEAVYSHQRQSQVYLKILRETLAKSRIPETDEVLLSDNLTIPAGTSKLSITEP